MREEEIQDSKTGSESGEIRVHPMLRNKRASNAETVTFFFVFLPLFVVFCNALF